MISSEIADLEEYILEGADCRFGRQFGRVGNYAGEGFKNGGAGGHDVGAGVGDVPVAAVLRAVSYVCKERPVREDLPLRRL